MLQQLSQWTASLGTTIARGSSRSTSSINHISRTSATPKIVAVVSTTSPGTTMHSTTMPSSGDRSGNRFEGDDRPSSWGTISGGKARVLNPPRDLVGVEIGKVGGSRRQAEIRQRLLSAQQANLGFFQRGLGLAELPAGHAAAFGQWLGALHVELSEPQLNDGLKKLRLGFPAGRRVDERQDVASLHAVADLCIHSQDGPGHAACQPRGARRVVDD